MTLKRFETLLKTINPNLRVRQRPSYGDNGGIFVKGSGTSGYISRITLGELSLAGYRHIIRDPNNLLLTQQGAIRKRGRKTLINLLRSYRWIKTHKQRSMLAWGLEPS
jgi:hypothetical protein